MKLLAAARKRWAIRSYVYRLPKRLRRDHGEAARYTPEQVRSTIQQSGLNTDYSCYAIAMFSDPADFATYHQVLGEVCDYGAMRMEVASSHFGGDADFAVADVFDASAAMDFGGGADGESGGFDSGDSDSGSTD